MLSVTNLTAIWRGKRGKHVADTPISYFALLFGSYTVCRALEINSYINSRPQLATRLLAHKIQSPQEWEAMQALLVSVNLS